MPIKKAFHPPCSSHLRRSAPPVDEGSHQAVRDEVVSLRKEGEAGQLTYSADWAPQASDDRPKLNGFQKGAVVVGLGLTGLTVIGAVSGGGKAPEPPRTRVSRPVQTQEVEAPVSLVETAEPSDAREVLVDLSHRAHAQAFLPGTSKVYEEAYIQTLVERDLARSELAEDSPKFTALGVDDNQATKIYLDANLEEVGWGKGTSNYGDFFTRPTRMNGNGSGIRDRIIQYHLSCVYRLEEDTVFHGVELPAGLYRVVTMEPASQVATPHMQHGVCPGHRLKPSGSRIPGDYVPTQTLENGEAAYLNRMDILQIQTLSEKDQVRLGLE